VQIMDEVKGAGIERLGMVTSPKGAGLEEEAVKIR